MRYRRIIAHKVKDFQLELPSNLNGLLRAKHLAAICIGMRVVKSHEEAPKGPNWRADLSSTVPCNGELSAA